MRLFPLLLVLSCRPSPPVLEPCASLPAPSEVLARLAARSNERTSVRALGRATYFGEQGRIRLKMVLAAQRPAAVRIETLSPLEQPIDVMVSNGQRLWLLSNGQLREGPATPENVGRVLPFPMGVRSLVETLLGGIPADTFEATTLELDEDGAYVLGLLDKASGARVQASVDPASLAVLSADFGETHIAFEDLAEVAPVTGLFPKKIHVEVPKRDLDVRIQLKELELNVPLPEELFRIQAPPGVTPELLPSPPIVVPPSRTATVARWKSNGQAE